MTQTEEVVNRMLRFAEDAAELALRLRAGGLDMSHKKGDLGQALTEADLAISGMLHERFGPRLIEEETAGSLGPDRAATLLAEPDWTFVADPIDGTKPFAGGLAGWGTMIAVCRNGKPEASVCMLPTWNEPRGEPGRSVPPQEQRGLVLVAQDGTASWAPTCGGRVTAEPRLLSPARSPTFHVGWLCNAAKRFTLDYERGFFPWCESGAIADAALLATGRLDATIVNHMLWDLAPVLPLFKALGFTLYRWPDLTPAPAAMIELFDGFSAHEQLWLVCRSREYAGEFAAAIKSAQPQKT